MIAGMKASAAAVLLTFSATAFAQDMPVLAPLILRELHYHLLQSEQFGTVSLGYGDLSPTETWGRALSVAQAGIGFGFLAVIISYLPVLYQAFSRREITISMLDAVCSAPVWPQIIGTNAPPRPSLQGSVSVWPQL